VPIEHVLCGPHAVPFGLLPTAVQVGDDVAEAQLVTPTAQTSAGWQDCPATHAATQEPEEQTKPEPHEVESGKVPVELQVPGVTEELQVSSPLLHGSAGWQATPALHVGGTHAPPLHTLLPPQVVPSALLLVVMQTASPVVVGQEDVPVVQTLGGWQSWFATQVEAMHVPALHTRPVPQVVPSTRFWEVSMQTALPVVQLVLP